jgi:hypothetical protein
MMPEKSKFIPTERKYLPNSAVRLNPDRRVTGWSPTRRRLNPRTGQRHAC